MATSTTSRIHLIIMILVQSLALIIVAKLHINYMMNATHPESIITGLLFIFIMYSIYYSIANAASLKA